MDYNLHAEAGGFGLKGHSLSSEQDRPLHVSSTEEAEQGEYANATVIHRAADEYVLDFVREVPAGDTAQLRARVFMSHATFEKFTRQAVEAMAKA